MEGRRGLFEVSDHYFLSTRKRGGGGTSVVQERRYNLVGDLTKQKTLLSEGGVELP